MANKALFISILGEAEHYEPENFTSLCPSGYERDWVLGWHGGAVAENGLALEGVDICRGEELPAADRFAGRLGVRPNRPRQDVGPPYGSRIECGMTWGGCGMAWGGFVGFIRKRS